MTTHQVTKIARQDSSWSALRPVVVGALVLLAARVLYLAFLCTYTLVEDEAQYWVWSKHLSLSYYTKGPGVAWAIFASTSVFGDDEWAIRLPGAIGSSIALIAASLLAHDCFADTRTTRRSAWCFVLVPAFLVAGFIMTVDGPLIACWALASWCAWRVLGMGEYRYGLALGLVIGLGVLFKYTMLLILPGLALFALISRHENASGRRAAAWLIAGALLMLLACLPMIVWNHQHDWPTLRHQLGHLGLRGGDVEPTQGSGSWQYNPLWTLTLIGTQLGLIGPVLVLGIWGAVEAWKERFDHPAAWRSALFLLCASAPVYLFYLAVSFIAEPEGNWPLAGAVTLVPLAGRRVVRGWDDYLQRLRAWRAMPKPRPWRGVFMKPPWTATSLLWCSAIVIGVAVVLPGARLDLLARVPGVGHVVPLGRFTRHNEMGAHAGELLNVLRERTALEPFVVAAHYGRAAQLSYYIPGRPDVYCASSMLPGGRVTPWDFWPELDLRRSDALIGRPALVVGGTQQQWEQVFDRVERVGALRADHKLDAHGHPTRPAFMCEGFRGMPSAGVREPGSKTRASEKDGGR